MHIIHTSTDHEFYEHIAFFIGSLISTRTEDVHIALAGGSTPAMPYRMTAQKALDFKGVHWYQTDERYVSATHQDSNQRMIQEVFTPAIPFLFHPIPTALPLAEACTTYAAQLPTFPFDLMVLGIGTDGHIASIFPDTVIETSPVFASIAPDGTPRITLHPDIIMRSRRLLVLLSGASKQPILEALQTQRQQTPPLPMELLYTHPDLTVITRI